MQDPTQTLESLLRSMLADYSDIDQLPAKVFQIHYPFISVDISSCIVKLTDRTTHETEVGKVLLQTDISLRPNSTRQQRHRHLADGALRSQMLSPNGVCIGLRPILKIVHDELYCGELTDPGQLDSRFEYMWFMYMLPQGEGAFDKVTRNVAMLETLADAVHVIHRRATELSSAEAWKYANPISIRDKLLLNLGYFERAIGELQYKARYETYAAVWQDYELTQAYLFTQELFDSAIFRRALEDRIGRGGIRHGHGDLTLKNIWFSDYNHSDVIRDVRDTVLCFDPTDFNDAFCKIDTLSEAAMLLVDLERHVDHVDYSAFVHAYTRVLTGWNSADALILNYYMLEKSIVRCFMAGLYDSEVGIAFDFLKAVRTNFSRTQASFRRLQRFARGAVPVGSSSL